MKLTIDDSTATRMAIKEGKRTVAYAAIGAEVKAEEMVKRFNAHDELVATLQMFVDQWNACGPNSDFGRYFQKVQDAAVTTLYCSLAKVQS